MRKAFAHAGPFVTRVASLLFIGGGFVLLFLALYRADPGLDFHYIYWPTVRLWALEGVPLYGGTTRGFFNLPWTAFFLLPLALLSEEAGRAALACFTVGVLFLTTIVFSPPGRLRLLALGLVLCSLHTQYIAVSGQIDAFPLLGLVAGWWAVGRLGGSSGGDRRALWTLSLALVLLSLKPQVFLGVILVFLLALRRQGGRDWVVVLTLPAAMVVASFLAFGLDWPVRWWEAYRGHPPFAPTIVTTWRAAQELGLPVWAPALAVLGILAGAVMAYRRDGLTEDTLSLAFLTGALATTYSSPSSSAVLLAVAFPRLLATRPALAIPVYLLSFTPLLRLVFSFSVAWTDIALWWGLGLAAIALLWRRSALAQGGPPLPINQEAVQQ